MIFEQWKRQELERQSPPEQLWGSVTQLVIPVPNDCMDTLFDVGVFLMLACLMSIQIYF